MNNNPIGVLDSGVGGLTVLAEIVKELPQESFIYIGDSQNTPYGTKSASEIYTLSKRLIDFLLNKQVKLIVIACNTITVSSLDKFRKEYPGVPIIGAVPVVKTAVAVTKNKRIGILSTTRTAQSEYQKQLIETFADGCTVFNHGTDTLVPLIEEGKAESAEMQEVLQKALLPFQKENIDTLALGCTHFPFLKKQIQDVLGKNVCLLDSGGAIARHVERVLTQTDLLSENNNSYVTIYTTGNMNIAKKLLHDTIKEQEISFEEVKLDI